MVACTEKEAGERWCPQVRYSGNGNRGIGGALPRSSFCLGSKCMMWRWMPKRAPRVVAPEYRAFQQELEPLRPKSVPDDWVWVPASVAAKENRSSHWREPSSPKLGFCGLGPEPEDYT